jgi:hypothetical protein
MAATATEDAAKPYNSKSPMSSISIAVYSQFAVKLTFVYTYAPLTSCIIKSNPALFILSFRFYRFTLQL